MQGFQLTGKTYETAKWLVQVVFPAIAALYWGLAGVWGLPDADKVTATSALVCVFLGIVLRISNKNYEANESGIAGTLSINVHPEKGVVTELNMRGAAVNPLMTKAKTVTFKLDRPEPIPPPVDNAA